MAPNDLSLEVADLRSVIPLRFAILRPGEADPSRCDYPGDRDDRAVHLRLLKGESAIGMVSVLPDARELVAGRPAAISRIRALGVLPKYQGSGLGRWILTRTIEVARERSLLPTWGSGRSHLAPFYNSIGAVTCSDPYEIPGTGEHLDFFIPATN